MANVLTVEEIHELNFGLIGGWKPLQTVYENKMGSLGWPTGEKRRAALELYYSRWGVNAVLTSDISYLRFVVSCTHFVLKNAELDQWSATDQTLPHLKFAYDAGYAPAVKHAWRFCNQTNTPMESWILDWQDKTMKDAARTSPRAKKSTGRHRGPSAKQWMDDLHVFVLVNFLRSQVRGTDRAGMPRWVSFNMALKVVQGIRIRRNEPSAISTLLRAYKRTHKRFLPSRFDNRSIRWGPPKIEKNINALIGE